MNDATNTSRRYVVVFALKEEIKARESEWKEKWDETFLDLMWHMFNGVVMKHATNVPARQSIEVNCTSTSRRREGI